ncbi:hypothetical protein HF1_04080 [Mycoplasma haemofelis str. Langford 1]|uniref:Uncharacterized protein n=1 Tax=Mycoplasma haemofelis (strain Langford 1) TaxID=941640 RepID=E8ZGZ5_MYCHL|nr:hypothetical protein [Mycoplasma haemofelis]CBY92416.1 hypothetical protein HF1_04080 [Mycoplasma haemofelis str. Langford 1]
MSILPKAAAGTLGAGGVIGGGILVSQQLSKDNKNTLATKLQEDGFTLIRDNNTQWNDTLSKYNQVKEKADEVFTTSKTDLTVDQLKEKCSSLLQSETYSQNDKDKASRWCTMPISVKDRIEKQGRRVLSDTDNDQKDKDTWTTLVKNHLSAEAKNKMNVNITALGNSEVDDTRINEMKKGCKALKDKTSLDKDYLSDYSKFQDWCSVPVK